MALPSSQSIYTTIEQGLDFVCDSYLQMQASNSHLLNYLHRSVITMYGSPQYLCLEKQQEQNAHRWLLQVTCINISLFNLSRLSRIHVVHSIDE